jgi:hypothetical protein
MAFTLTANAPGNGNLCTSQGAFIPIVFVMNMGNLVLQPLSPFAGDLVTTGGRLRVYTTAPGLLQCDEKVNVDLVTSGDTLSVIGVAPPPP